MLLVDPASTSRCQHALVTWHFLTDKATVILSFTWTPGLDRRTCILGSVVDGWRTWPQLGGNHHDARTPSLERMKSDGERRQFCCLTVRNTISSSSLSLCGSRVCTCIAHSHSRSCETILSRSAKEASTVLLECDFAAYTLLWGFCISSFFSCLKDNKDNL